MLNSWRRIAATASALTLTLICAAAFSQHDTPTPALFQKHAPPALSASWRPGCPVGRDQLALLDIAHWDGQRARQGRLVVHRDLADEVLAIFQELYRQRFPIQQMRLIDDDAYRGDDARSMADNNTSAFNCRKVTGGDRYSRHSYGVAIDINPLLNPYVKNGRALPPASEAYVDRNRNVPGMIRKNDAVYRAFTSRGWRWGGDWRSLKDYQHFEKPL